MEAWPEHFLIFLRISPSREQEHAGEAGFSWIATLALKHSLPFRIQFISEIPNTRREAKVMFPRF